MESSQNSGRFDLETLDRSLLIELLMTAKEECECLSEKINAHEETISQFTINENSLTNQIKRLQIQLDAGLTHQARVEAELNERQNQVDNLTTSVQDLSRENRDLEKRLRQEEESYDKHKETWMQKELELESQIKDLSIAVNGHSTRNLRNNQSGHAGVIKNDIADTTLTSSIAPVTETIEKDFVNREGMKSETELTGENYDDQVEMLKSTMLERENKIKNLERQITTLKSDTSRIKEDHRELFGINMNLNVKSNKLEQELKELRNFNESLMEENESYQVLLQERTMNGDFLMNPIMQENMPKETAEKRVTGFNLAAELDRANAPSSPVPSGIMRTASIGDTETLAEKDEKITKLTEELKAVKESNKALSLYVSKIIDRIIAHRGFEAVLAADYDPESAAKQIPANEEEEFVDSKLNRRRTIGGFSNMTDGGMALFADIQGFEGKGTSTRQADAVQSKMKPLFLSEKRGRLGETPKAIAEEDTSIPSINNTPSSKSSSTYATPETSESSRSNFWKRASLQYGKAPKMNRDVTPSPKPVATPFGSVGINTTSPPMSGFSPSSPSSPTNGVGSGFVGDVGGWGRKIMTRQSWFGWGTPNSTNTAKMPEDKYTIMNSTNKVQRPLYDGVEQPFIV